MATLNVNNEVIAVFGDNFSCIFNVATNSYKNLENECPQNCGNEKVENYLGLTRYCSVLSNNGKWYAIIKERNLLIWSTADWNLKSSKLLERSASKIIFMPSDKYILVADKTGDVYLFSVLDDEKSKGTLLLGHVSMLLDIAVTSDEKFIITCDRDEKIRVTCFPNTYNINSFCLGHIAFVTRILLLNNNVMISSSGDGTIKFWLFIEGKMLSSYSVSSDVKHHIEDCHLRHYIISNLNILNNKSNEKILCLSIHELQFIFIYHCILNSEISVCLIQKLPCHDLLDIAINNKLLWILSRNNTITLSVLSWNANEFKFLSMIPNNLKNILTLLNNIYKNKEIRSNLVDLTVLYKKFDYKQKNYKKIKL